MKNFFRKVAYGIGPNDNTPSDPLKWALNQLDDVPDLSWKGKTSLYINSEYITLKKQQSAPSSYPYLKLSIISIILLKKEE